MQYPKPSDIDVNGPIKDFQKELEDKLNNFFRTFEISKELKAKFNGNAPKNFVFFYTYNYLQRYGINNILTTAMNFE